MEATFPKCQSCSQGDLVPLLTLAAKALPVDHKAWVCTNPYLQLQYQNPQWRCVPEQAHQQRRGAFTPLPLVHALPYAADSPHLPLPRASTPFFSRESTAHSHAFHGTH